MNITLLSLLVDALKDSSIIDLGDGYAKVTTASYSIDVPKGWDVSSQTPWGQRTARPAEGSGELGVKTAPPSSQTWDDLYHSSLSYILRESKAMPTPYRVTKTKKGFEAAAFELLDADGFPSQRYVLIRDEARRLLTLSVKVPSREVDTLWTGHFERLVESAIFLPK